MSARDKAISIHKRIYDQIRCLNAPIELSYETAKAIAIDEVDEIIEALSEYDNRNDTYELQNMDGDFRWWDIVKQELKNL
jgi:hypothetical protein